MKLSQALQGFLIYKQAVGLSPRTANIYQWALDKLVAFTGDAPVENLTTGTLVSWFAYLRTDYKPTRPGGDTRPLAPESIKNAWRALKSFSAWAEQEMGIPRVDRIPSPTGESPEIHPFTPEEVARLVRASESITVKRGDVEYQQRRRTSTRNAALIILLLDTGLRIGELTRLRIEHVDIQTGEIIVFPTGSGAKSKGRSVYLGRRARMRLWKYLSERPDAQRDDPLFETEAGRPATRDTVRRVLSRIGKRAGVHKVHPHRFRHTFAIEYLRAGGDVFTLQRLLGHRSLEMVKRYLLLAQSDVREAHRLYSPADRQKL